jgi:hypothetical protein
MSFIRNASVKLSLSLLLCVQGCVPAFSFILPNTKKPAVSNAAAGAGVSVDFDSNRWQIQDPKGRKEDHLGRKSLYLTSGYAFLPDVVFENGVIEVDIAAQNLASFVGVVFRSEKAGEHEIVYFRPHKSGQEDAVQYTPSFNGGAGWQLYSGKGFTAVADIPKEQWLHTRIEISGLGGKVYFNNSDKPVLIIEDLKHGYSHGSIGLWGGANGGYFSNFSYKVEAINERPNRAAAQIPAGILSKWELSEAFDVTSKNPESLPSASELKALQWQAVQVEAPGMLVIDRYRQSANIVQFFASPADRTGRREGRKAVFARAVIYSDSAQVKRLSIGYSDEATVFLNGKPVFTGKSAFRFRDPGFLGIMNVEDDALYLDLKKGRNEIILGVADYFGGWGFICRLDDLRGVKLD